MEYNNRAINGTQCICSENNRIWEPSRRNNEQMDTCCSRIENWAGKYLLVLLHYESLEFAKDYEQRWDNLLAEIEIGIH